MLTFQEIIDAFTVSRLAAMWGLPESHVRTMRARDSIPPEYWQDLLTDPPDALKEQLTADALKEARRSRFNRRRRPDQADSPQEPSHPPFTEAAP